MTEEEKYLKNHFRSRNQCQYKKARFAVSSNEVNVEDAVINVGDAQGNFIEIGNREIERDPNYPIRVTLQFYKTTDNGIINQDVVETIAKQIESSRKNADYIGSLVIGPVSNRPTEHISVPKIPFWWRDFWLTYRNLFPQFTEEQAKMKVFEGGRFENSTMNEAQDRILAILGHNEKPVSWNMLG